MGVLTPNKYAYIPKQKAQKLPEYYNTHIAVGPPNFLENIVPILMSWTARVSVLNLELVRLILDLYYISNVMPKHCSKSTCTKKVLCHTS